MDEHDPIMATIGGQRFELRVDVLTMRQLRKLDPPIDIRNLVDPDDPERGLWRDMRDDPAIVAEIAYWAIQGQIGAPDDPDAFARGLRGSELEALYQSVLRACVSFIPSHRTRELMTKIVAKVDAIEGKLATRAMDRLDEDDLDDRILAALDSQQSTERSGSWRDSSVSTQGGTRSES